MKEKTKINKEICFLYLGIVDSPECVELLLHHGAKVNAQDLKNNTAAMVACFFNKPRILTTIIRAGADLTVRNNEGIKEDFLTWIWFSFFEGKDAYDVAVEKEFDDCKDFVAKALEKRGIKPGSKPTPTATATDKLTEDVDKLKLKR